MKRILTLAAAAAALACGSNNTNNAAVSRNNPGTGTSTLLVQGDINATQTTGTTPAPAPQTTFSVTVKDGSGANISGATVTVLNSSVPDGVVNLVEAPAGSGRYSATVASYPTGDFHMNVVKGTDSVQGVVVGGPGMAAINAPVVSSTGTTTVTANQDLAVSWTTPAVGKQVTVSTRDTSFTGPDLGAYTIVAAQNPARLNQRLRVDRFNEVEAAGGLVGSRLSVMYRVAIDPFNVQ
jgi:hypothetical protein